MNMANTEVLAHQLGHGPITETLHPPGIFGDHYFWKPYTYSYQNQVVCKNPHPGLKSEGAFSNMAANIHLMPFFDTYFDFLSNFMYYVTI